MGPKIMSNLIHVPLTMGKAWINEIDRSTVLESEEESTSVKRDKNQGTSGEPV